MLPTETTLKPTANKALIRFIFPKGGGYIWDGDKFLGTGWPKAQFDYYAEPGVHLFFTTLENKSFLEADLESGKTYYILGRVWFGVWRPRVGFVAINRGSEYWDKVHEYEKTFKKYELDPASLKEWEDQHKEKMKEIIAEYDGKWKKEYDWPKLSREDGR